MSSLAVRDEYGMVGAEELTKPVRDEINAAREDRKRIEPIWHMNMAFAAGKFWLGWNRNTRELVFPPELVGRELYSADVITEYRTTALGELGSDDDRPELLLRRDDQLSEDYQAQLNRAVGWGWDYEWKGDDALEEARRLCLDMGTSAIRCRFDPTVGPVLSDSVPHSGGIPIRDPEQAYEAMSNGPTSDIEMRPVQQGRITWDVLSPFNIIVPPGVPNERDFPWQCVVRPALLAAVKKEYGDLAAELKEDSDIGSVLGLDVNSEMGNTIGLGGTSGKAGRLKGHVWLFTYYENPTPRYTQGRTIVFGGNKMKPLKITERLPYIDPNGTYCAGIVYFHWWRVTGRFWSRSLVENMQDVQRLVNKRRTQSMEIIDRAMPAVFVERNSPAKERRGVAMELIEIGQQERQPTIFPGVGPGPWIQESVQDAREDLEHATGIRGPRLGENPVNVTTYAQLALLNENDQVKRSMILREHKLSIGKLVESSIYDMRTYWGPERQIALVGEEDQVDATIFNATKIPPFFIVRVAKGISKPRSQAAELKKIEDIWNAALAAGATMMNPLDWVEWLKSSLDQGMSLDLPEGGTDEHEDKAELENSLIDAGQSPFVQYYDPAEIHIPIHRQGQIQAELNQDVELWQRYEVHIQSHVLTTQQTAGIMASMAPEEPMPMEGEQPGQPQEEAPA